MGAAWQAHVGWALWALASLWTASVANIRQAGGAVYIAREAKRRTQCVAVEVPRHRLSNKALAITLTELRAIAAPATSGLKYPRAASGMPAVL